MNILQELFSTWNTEFFQGKLASLPLKFYCHRGSRCGAYYYGTQRFIKINTSRGEQDQKQTLLHEMIHAYLHAIGHPHGHTSEFKRLMRNLTHKVWGYYPTENVRFHFEIPGNILYPVIPVPNNVTKEVPVDVLLPASINRWKVISNGKIGTFIREGIIYGKKSITLRIEGMTFPFTTEVSNVVKA